MSTPTSSPVPSSQAGRPNVVLICVDQWRGDCLSADGHPIVRTPYLDALAARGVRFRNAYSATPTCVPARMALLTGLSQERHRRVGYQDGVDFDIAETLPRSLAEDGYQTQAIGKMHYSPERIRIGFDDVILHDGYLHHSRWRERDPRFYDDYLTWLRAQAGSSAVDDYLENGINCNSVVARPWDKPERLHPTNWVVTEAENWLYRRDPTRPFFLYLSFHRPHAPYDPPAWAFEQYLDAPFEEPPVGDWVGEFAHLRNDALPDANVARYDARTSHRARAGYYGHISHIDAQINRFLEILAEFGVADDTYILFTSDHGDMLGDHDMWRKGYPYEGSARVPMILAGPTIAPGQVSDDIVELRDVMPTLLGCADVAAPDLDGRDLRATVGVREPEAWTGVPPAPGVAGTATAAASASDAGRGLSPDEPHLHGEHVILGQSMQWIRAGRWKYVWLSASGREQLFDLVSDPGELRNRVHDDAASEALRACRDRLIADLRGRPEGFVDGDALVPGRPVQALLPEQHVSRA
ncbi:arylsulfatase [Microbacterium sp. H1-D42]|uniref:arylsulfatase n=1 Tax=Microbacterium sp. H1-D42 TaxID=2925844 RepID=UPI001F539408|nr:arylsulfatase [Microbacterium sp. H1-D42]UNK71252.1 arylsulfatase [Microbacterium sp. H1-D42]